MRFIPECPECGFMAGTRHAFPNKQHAYWCSKYDNGRNWGDQNNGFKPYQKGFRWCTIGEHWVHKKDWVHTKNSPSRCPIHKQALRTRVKSARRARGYIIRDAFGEIIN